MHLGYLVIAINTFAHAHSYDYIDHTMHRDHSEDGRHLFNRRAEVCSTATTTWRRNAPYIRALPVAQRR